MKITLFFLLLILFQISKAQNHFKYQIPNADFVKLLEAESTPSVMLDPNGEWLLQKFEQNYPPINRLVKDELRLAGVRINPLNYDDSRSKYIDSLVLTNIKSGKDYTIKGLPDDCQLKNFVWSPNGKYIAFTNTSIGAVELWIASVGSQEAKQIIELNLNSCLPINPITWVDGGEWMVCTTVPGDKGRKPTHNAIPKGPQVMESRGEKAAVRTFQDLLKNEFDKKLFSYYAESQLVKVSIEGEHYPIGIPAIFKHVSVSPDYRFLLVKMIHEPFSLIVPYYRFPFKVEIWDNDGNLVRDLFSLPLAENIPQGFGAVRKGPRDISWRSDKPATLYWVMAMDEGDPKRDVVVRDRLFLFDYPFDGKGYESIAYKNRYGGVDWGIENFAVTYEWWWETRTRTVYSFDPKKGESSKKMMFEYDWQDDYKHPGYFMKIKNEQGKPVIAFDSKGEALYLNGKGGTPEGYKPFVDKYNIKKGETERMWQSNDPYYEYSLAFINTDKELLLTRRESKSDVPNYFTRNLKNGVVAQITNYINPYPQLEEMKQELIKYKRNDGIQLSGTLYTPPGYSLGDGLLPMLMWAYPNEYKSAASASQVKDSPNKFVRIGWWSPVFWTLQGFAVLDYPSMPIIGEGEAEPNDTFVEQLVANAEAAIKCVDSMGVVDVNRVAIGGHSYGAFMAANLLAHSNLFAAGIARSGAYNRTLTPFGFQSEQRSFWEASDTYMKMSPFTYVHKINEPLLLIHGDADNNSGTYPMQSERMFSAIKGNGGEARLVMLPHESHGYRAKESIFHMLWEMNVWLNKHVKQNGK